VNIINKKCDRSHWGGFGLAWFEPLFKKTTYEGERSPAFAKFLFIAESCFISK